MRVLVLDPDASSRDALRQGFSSAGASVRVFSEPLEAERAVDAFEPDLVVAALDAGASVTSWIHESFDSIGF